MARKWARWVHNPLPPGGCPPLQRGMRNHRWTCSGQAGYMTPAAWGVPIASKRGQNKKWRQAGYMTPAAWGVPTASEGGGGGRITGGPEVGKVAT